MKPDAYVVESEEDLIAAAMPQIRPIRDQVEYAQVREAANADGAVILDQTHLILKGGTIVGSVGLGTLPIFTLWLAKSLKARDSAMIVNIVENLCRMRGLSRVACLVAPESPFVAVCNRFGYQDCGGSRWLMKGL